MRNIVYFKICNDENEYRKMHPYKTKKCKWINYIMKQIYYYKMQIMKYYNIIEILNNDNKKTYVVNTTLENRRKVLLKIENKISQISYEDEDTKIIISKQIKQLINENASEKNIKRLNIILQKGIENKTIYKDFLNEIINSVIKLKKEIPEEQSIYILLNSNNIYYINLINKIISDYKMINIVTQHIELFKNFEERAEENLEPISILNNKRKSISKAKYIINIDYSYEELMEYSINRTAIIFNVSNTSLKKLVGFEGIVINNIKIKQKGKEFDLEDEYETDKSHRNEVLENIEKCRYELEGNNGEIEFKELFRLDKTEKKV